MKRSYNGSRKKQTYAPLRPLIPAWFDDLNLRPAAARVLQNLWRRADSKTNIATPCTARIARECRIHIDTLWPVLTELEELGLFRRFKEGGHNKYEMRIPDAATLENFGRKIEAAGEGNGGCSIEETEGFAQRKRRVLDPEETEGYKGIPLKGASASNPAFEQGSGTGSRGGGLPEPSEWNSKGAEHFPGKQWTDLEEIQQRDVVLWLHTLAQVAGNAG